MPNAILAAAKNRLLAIAAERAALDQEERELRAMVVAAEGVSAGHAVPFTLPFEPLPALPPWQVQPFTPPLQPAPIWPPPSGPVWYVDPRPTITCGIQAQPLTLYVGDVNPSSGSVIASGSLTFADAEMLSNGWRRCGVSDVTGGPYYVKGPDLSPVTLS